MGADQPMFDIPEDGKLAQNIVHFARALRKAGIGIGTGRIVDAIRAVETAGFTNKQDFYWILHSCFVSRNDHRTLFAQTFKLFWRDPKYLEHMMSMLLPMVRGVQEDKPAQAGERRAADALIGDTARNADSSFANEGDEIEIVVDASLTVSPEERLRNLDFEQMTNAEAAEARRMISKLAIPVRPLVSRRMRARPNGRFPDWRKTMRDAMSAGGEIRGVSRRDVCEKWPSLVALCDISGSMSAYSRTLLHFLHSVSTCRGAGWSRVHAFTFGTRLTNISRHLSLSDVDTALAAAGSEARDWEGGTRIADCIRTFNFLWSRRVMGSGAIVLLITDGLECGECDGLGKEMERLRLSAKRLIWINPLLRWADFAPRAAGIKEMLPHVDCFRSGHNLASLAELAEAVMRSDDCGEKQRLIRAIQN